MEHSQKGWIEEHKSGRPNFNAINEADNKHQIEVVGRELRAMMPFVKPKVKKWEFNPTKK
ncbi:hypothetical protein GCM10020331_069240 [Ectobacillus funiculus]